MEKAFLESLLYSTAILTFEDLGFLLPDDGVSEEQGGASFRASARIHFRGPSEGYLCIRLYGGFLPELTANMLGEEEIPSEEGQADVLGELSNVICGNLLPVPFILLFLDAIVRLLSRFGIFKRFFDHLFARVKKKERALERYGKFGLCLFVGIPFPVTGAWTGSLLAFLLGFRLRYSFLSIIAGVFMAGGIVTALCLLGFWGAVIAGIGIAGLAILGLWKVQ